MIDSLMPSSPAAFLRAVAHGKLDGAVKEAACIYKDYLTVIAIVAGIATPFALLAGGAPGVITGLFATIAGLLIPIVNAVCQQRMPSFGDIAIAASGVAALTGQAQGAGVNMGNVPASDLAAAGEAFGMAAEQAGKVLPKNAPAIPAVGTMSTAEKLAAAKRKAKAIAIAKAKARARSRMREAQRARDRARGGDGGSGGAAPPSKKPASSGTGTVVKLGLAALAAKAIAGAFF